MRHDHAEYGVAQELEALVRFQATTRPLIDVRSVDQRCLQQRGVAEGVAERPGKGLRRGRRVLHDGKAASCYWPPATRRRKSHLAACCRPCLAVALACLLLVL